MPNISYQGTKSPMELVKSLSRPAFEQPKPKTETVLVLNKDTRLPAALAELQQVLERVESADPVVVTEAVAKSIAKWLRKNESGCSREIPMKCLGPCCSYKDTCPLLAAGIQPKAMQPCPLEDHLVEKWSNDMATTLKIDTDPRTNAGDLRTINHSSMLEITLRRNAMEMSADPHVVEEVAIGVDPKTGEVIKSKRVNEHVKEMQNIIKAEEFLHSSLLVTRKSKAAVGKSLKEKEDEYLKGALAFVDATVVPNESSAKTDPGSPGSARGVDPGIPAPNPA